MTNTRTLPVCDECNAPVAESFHAILGGKIYRLCGEPCRRMCRSRFKLPRPKASAELRSVPATVARFVPRMSCGVYGDEWDNIPHQL